jgi:RND family efflux transporter MFP subunit
MRSLGATLLGLSARLVVAGAIVGATVAGVGALHAAAQARDEARPEVRPPLPVRVVAARPETGYEILDRYVGRLEPAREARLAFERGGLVVDVAVEEGARVAAGDAVARLDTALLEAERARLLAQRQQAAAELELARLTLERQRALNARGHAPDQRLDEARLDAAALAARLAQTDAAIRAVEVDISKAVIRAPFAGTVAARLVDEGAVVAAGTPVADLLETGRPRARVGLSPEAAAALEAGARVRLTVGGREVGARLEALRPDLSAATRTVAALFALDAPPAPFGETAELAVARRIPAEGTWLPLTALVEGRRGLWSVFAVAPDGAGGHAVARESVEVLHVAGGRAFVRGTLADGALVVAAGAHRVIPGQAVVPAADAASAD